MNEFLHSLLCNTQLANIITSVLHPVASILSFKSCKIIRQLEIDYDLIEVKPYGVCFSFTKKRFLTNAIPDGEIGIISPRTYISYTYKPNVVPLPQLFVNSLRNSLPSEDQLLLFLQKWYQLALKDLFPQKTKKLCCVGDPDSGKTSWFAPYEGIISQDKLASVTRDRHFSASMLSSETECLFVDEWPPDSLTGDDAKRILQGGYIAIPQKHKEAVRVVYRSGVYITCNEIPPFAEIDDRAIRARLVIFQTKSLRSRNPYATNWLRRNCMQCFHWAAERLQGTPLWADEEPLQAFETEDEGALYNDFTEKRAAELINVREIEQLEFSEDLSSIVASASTLPDNILPAETVEKTILNYETTTADNWTREESDSYIVSGDINDYAYHKAVFWTTMSKHRWASLNPTEDDLERFERRRRNHWYHPDSMYDAWLLIEDTPRPEFDVDLLKARFPHWEEKMKRQFDGRRKSYLSSTSHVSTSQETSVAGSSDASHCESVRGKRRPNTMTVPRRAKIRKISSSSSDDE